MLTTPNSRPVRSLTRDSASSGCGMRRAARRRSESLRAIDPLARCGHVSQYPSSTCRSEHADHPLRAVTTSDIHRPGCGGSVRCKGQDVAAAKQHWIGAGRLGRQSNLHAGKQVREHDRRIDRPVDLQIDIARPYTVPVPILNDSNADAGRTVEKSQCDGRRAADRLGSREGHTRREIPRGREAPRAFDRGHRLRNRDSADHAERRTREDEIDERESVRTARQELRAVRQLANYCSALLPLPDETVTSGFSFRKFFSPIPRTFIRSSIFLKPPLLSRYSRIRSAVDLPMPGSVSSWAIVAVFRFNGPDADAFAAGVVRRGASCPACVAMPNPRINRTIIRMRIMSCLQSVPGRRGTPAARERTET